MNVRQYQIALMFVCSLLFIFMLLYFMADKDKAYNEDTVKRLETIEKQKTTIKELNALLDKAEKTAADALDLVGAQ